MVRMFGPSAVITLAALAIGGYVGGLTVFFAVAVLIVLEVVFSFDNAVVNAKVLTRMSEFWQKMFLTVGVLIAVFGMRLVFPIAIVSLTAHLGPLEVIDLALNNPDAYQHEVEAAGPAIFAFGGIFLMMIFLDFVLDPEREIHWLAPIERPLARIGKLDQLSVVVALLIIFAGSYLAPAEDTTTVFTAGLIGLIIYLLVNGLDEMFGSDEDDEDEDAPSGSGVTAKGVAGAGFATFMYLELLDASFSLDGVIGAFAVSNDILVIALGLGVGAFWVRSMTIYLVRKGTLAEYIYLEHGAHWAIGTLATMMILELKFHISEYVTGLSGVVFIVFAVISSVIEKRRGVATEDTAPSGLGADHNAHAAAFAAQSEVDEDASDEDPMGEKVNA